VKKIIKNIQTRYDTDGYAVDVAVSGNYAYITDNSGIIYADVNIY
jgi:hypothetical protein